MTILVRMVLALALFAAPGLAAEVGDDGLHKQPFLADTFLDMGEDLAEANAAGKDLMILIEQRGCPYCAEMHNVNFARDDIVTAIEDSYVVVQLDMWGAREVTDFDGRVMAEKDFVRSLGASFTPTTLFFTMGEAEEPPTDALDALVFVLPGYFKPFHHLAALDYVSSDGYRDEPNFQRWLQARAERMREEGQEVEIWQ